jgi:CHAT domain-containing protein/tetratricopeptide (TPR) repeat protein
MKKIYFLTLVLISKSLFAQKSFNSSKADSLHFCGYFNQEIALRKASPQNTIEYKILLDNAQVNIHLQNQEIGRAILLFDKILAEYKKIKSPQSLAFYMHLTQARVWRGQEKWKEAVAYLSKLSAIKNPKTVYDGMLMRELAQNSEYADGVKSYKSAIEIFEKNGWQNHYCTALAYNNLAYNYTLIQMEREAMKVRERAAEIWSKYYENDIDKLAITYNNIIYNFLDYGDKVKCQKYQKVFEQRMNQHFEKVAKGQYIPMKKYDNSHARMMFHLSSIRYYGDIFEPKKIDFHLQKLEETFKKTTREDYEQEFHILPAAYDEVAYAYRVHRDYVNALKYNAISEKIARSDFEKMKAQAMYAMIFYEKKDYPKALEYAEKSLKSMSYEGKGTSYFTVSVLKAEVLAQQKKQSEAIKTLMEAYQLMTKKKVDITKLKISDFGEVSSGGYVNIFIKSGLIYRKIYEQNRKKSDLKTMQNFYKLASAMFERFYQKGIFNPALDQYLRSIKEGLLYADVNTPEDKNEMYATLNSLENNSSQHLFQRLMLRNQENFNLSKVLLENKNELQLQKSILESVEKPTEKQKAELENIQKELVKIQKNIVNQNPNFKRFNAIDFDIRTIQSQLKENRIIVKYTVADSTVYAHLISAKVIKVFDLGSKIKLESLCKIYYEKLRKINFDFINHSTQLHQILIKPLGITTQQIDFITEDFLSYVPFETLTDNQGKMMVNKGILSYNHSLKIWNSTFSKSGSYKYNLTGFAPEYGSNIVASRDVNGKLIYTASEMEKIAKIFKKSRIFKSETATKKNFLSSIGQSKIHHLAMHSMLNESDYEESNLLFQNDEKVSFKELYALNFPSELVVLSACNTGIGQQQSGEGLMSISRALNYAGVLSLVHSLWQVPDKETAELMGYFYEYLSDSKPKNEALALAKQTFIQKNPSKTHPYYWAGFVLNGNTDSISERGYLWYILGGIFGVSILGFLFYRQRFQ